MSVDATANYDPFALHATDDAAWPPDIDPSLDATKRFDPADPLPLTKLLQSDDLMTSRRGLRVFAELGRKGFVVLDDALKLNAHPHDMARNALMDGVICYPELLGPDQARAVLHLVRDSFPLVREKAIVFLAYVDLGSLEAAINALDDPARSEHRSGLGLLRAEHAGAQALFDEALVRNDIWSAHAFACLSRNARTGVLTVAPEYTGDDHVAALVVTHIKMHIARRDFRRRRKVDPRARYRSP